MFCDEDGGGGNVPVSSAMVVAMSVSWPDVIDGPKGPFWRDDSIALRSELCETP
jgi:hypothetical protein